MYATKRKFHNLLNSLTNNGSSVSLQIEPSLAHGSTTTLPASGNTPLKKRRLALPHTAAPKASSPDPASSPRSIRAGSGPSSDPSEKRRIPNFAPWDRSQFLSRLKTFRHVDKWTAKPAPINEVQWAKRGWSCVGKEMVGCVGGCEKEVYIDLREVIEDEAHVEGGGDGTEGDDDWMTGADNELIDRYREMIVSEHDESCLWTKRGCDGKPLTFRSPVDVMRLKSFDTELLLDTIYRLSLNNPPVSIEHLQARYLSLASMKDSLPSRTYTPGALDIESVIRYLPSSFRSAPATSLEVAEVGTGSTAIQKQALSLALFGWQAEEGHIEGLATCEACFRRLGLWLFRSSKSSSSDAEDDEEVASMSRLDVMGEHREYCPWVNADSQQGTATKEESTKVSGEAGWQVLLRVLRDNFSIGTETISQSAEPQVGDGAEDELQAVGPSALSTGDESVRDAKDKERWSKLKQLKKAFEVKRSGRTKVS